MNFSCTLCGSRDWPDPHSMCPACRGDGEPEPDPDDERDAALYRRWAEDEEEVEA